MLKTKVIKGNRSVKIVTAHHNVEVSVDEQTAHAIDITINGVSLLIQTGYTTLNDEVTIFTPHVTIADYSGENIVYLKDEKLTPLEILEREKTH